MCAGPAALLAIRPFNLEHCMKFKPKSLLRAASGLTALALVSLTVPAYGKVLAKVDGVEITDDDVALALDDIGPTMPQDLQGPARDTYVLDYLIDLKLVARKAEADKAVDQADFARRMAYYRDKIIMEGALGSLGKQTNSDESLRKIYEDVAKAQKPEAEIHARHILVPTEAEARTALKRVQSGEDFAKVAKDVSKDPGSEGGDLGWFTKEQMVPEFAEAAFNLKPGQLSEPVKSQFGWHVIRLEERRDKPFPAFETVREQVARYAAQKSQSEYIGKLRQGAKIEKTEGPALLMPPIGK